MNNNNNNNNCYLLIGKSGAGKSTISKILTGNKEIKISSSLQSCTQKTNYYDGKIDDCEFTIIDTIGLNNSFGNDSKNVIELRQCLTNKDLKIKGIFIVMNSQDNRFGEYEQKILKKIIDLIPLDNIWNYISLVFTRNYTDKWHKIEDKNKELLDELENIFKKNIFEYSFKHKGIPNFDFNCIKKIFVDLNADFSSLEDMKDIINVIKESASYEPLFSDCEISNENNVEIIELDLNNSEKGVLP